MELSLGDNVAIISTFDMVVIVSNDPYLEFVYVIVHFLFPIFEYDF